MLSLTLVDEVSPFMLWSSGGVVAFQQRRSHECRQSPAPAMRRARSRRVQVKIVVVLLLLLLLPVQQQLLLLLLVLLLCCTNTA